MAAGDPGASWAPAPDPAEQAFASEPASATTQREYCSVAPPFAETLSMCTLDIYFQPLGNGLTLWNSQIYVEVNKSVR